MPSLCSVTKSRRLLRSFHSALMVFGIYQAGAPILAARPQSASSHQVANTPPKSDGNSKTEYHEDFTVLPLDKNKLTMDTLVLGEKDDSPNSSFVRERWHVIWRPGDPIDLYVVKPKGVEKPPVIIYLYSFPQDTDRFKENFWCDYATGGGYAAVGFVSAVTGQRAELRPLNQNFFNQLPEALGATVHDIQMILNYLTERGDLDMTRVGILGQGSGGGIAILASAVDPRIKALDLLTPWGDWPLFLEKSKMVPAKERDALTTPDFLKSVSGVDPLDWFPKVKARYVRIENLRGDGHMPDAAQEKLEDAAPPIAEIDQFGDGFAFYPMAANGRIFSWLKAALQPDAKPQAASEKSERVHYFPPKGDPNPLGLTKSN